MTLRLLITFTFIIGFLGFTANAEDAVTPEKTLKYYRTQASLAYSIFNNERKKSFSSEVDTVFLKIEKEFAFQRIDKSQTKFFNFNNLTQAVLFFAQNLRSQDQISLQGHKNAVQRRELQMNFIGLSQAIQKSNEINLQINSEQYNKLHDILVPGHRTILCVLPRETKNRFLLDILFFTSIKLSDGSGVFAFTARATVAHL